MVEHWNSDGGTVWWNSGTVMVEECGGRVWWKNVVQLCGGTVWWNSGTVLWNSGTVMVEQWNSDGGKVKQ